MLQIIRDNLFSEGRNSLNLKQREVFNVVQTWAKDYIKYDGLDFKPPDIFISDNGRTRKSPLLKWEINLMSEIWCNIQRLLVLIMNFLETSGLRLNRHLYHFFFSVTYFLFFHFFLCSLYIKCRILNNFALEVIRKHENCIQCLGLALFEYITAFQKHFHQM